jgi:transcriptional regulator with XRE-family HTH domain
MPLLVSCSSVGGERTCDIAVMKMELIKLGLRIKASREVLGRSQKDFAEQCGLDRSYFGGVERGERNLTFFSLCEICAGLDCDIAAVTKGILLPRTAPIAGTAQDASE